jgi:hypothetical protein
MSLTSYRAAPPRVKPSASNDEAPADDAGDSPGRNRDSKQGGLEDLAATYSPVP